MKHLWRPLLALLILAGAGALAASALDLDFRIDAFLPAPKNPDQRLIVDQIEGGAAGRLILAAIDGGEADELAETSRLLAERWRRLEGVERVDNGDWAEQDALIETLMRHRFVLIDDVERRVATEAVRAALDERLADLALAGARAEPLIRRDPLGLLDELAGRLAGTASVDSHDGVWIDQQGPRAVLSVLGRPAAFAIDDQARLLEQLRASFEDIADERFGLTLAGAPVIGVASAEASRSDAVRLSLWGGLLVLIVLAFAWRSASAMLAGAVPLACGVVCGLAVTVLAFDQVHGLTLAFGFTLLGVALDYPVHLFGHADHRPLSTTARKIRSPLLLGVASTLLAYGAIWVSSSPGLAQLGAFSAAGLAGAAAATLLLPALHPALPRRVQPTRIRPLHWPAVPVVLGLAGLAVLVWQGESRWSNDLSRLSPVDLEQLSLDRELRTALGGSDVRHLIAVEDTELEAVLEQVEAAVAVLEQARTQDLIERWQAVTDLLPSARTQQARLAAWPAAAPMRERLESASERFRADAFDDFLEDLSRAKAEGPISPSDWQGSPLAARLDALLSQTESGWRGLIMPAGVSDPARLSQRLAEAGTEARLVDLAAGSEAMVAEWRRDAGTSLGAAMLLIMALLLLRLRGWRDWLAVMLPPTAAVLVSAAALSLFDAGLTIVHLIGLLLVAGIGLDFALFTRNFRTDPPVLARSRRAINTCALSTGGVFLVLSQSVIGMLQMLGLTVALGVLLSWLFSRMGQPR